MKAVPAALQAHLDTGTTSFCWCWKLTTHAGTSFGFTDHDRDLSFGGCTFEAAGGFTGSEIEASLGLNVDSMDVTGALSSLKLNEADLHAGVFDNAAVEIWLVNWADVSQRVLLRAGNLGEVGRNETGFTAEIRAISHRLNQPQGRLFQKDCDTRLGSSRCKIDLADPQYKATGTVSFQIGRLRLVVTGIETFQPDWFSRGRLEFLTGNNKGHAMEIASHAVTGTQVQLTLRRELAHAAQPGDQFEITAGCDKTFATCRDRFANAINFQGFPHMPGNDFIAFYPNKDDANNDGGALV